MLPRSATEIGLALRLGGFEHGKGFVERLGLRVDVAGFQAFVDAALAAFHREHVESRHRGRQRLRAAHAAETGSEQPFAGDFVVEMTPAHFDKGFVRALHDSLAADVDPRTRGHLAVHGETLAVEFVEVVPGRPVRHQIRIGDQHARRIGMRREHPHRLARLHQQGFLLGQVLQGVDDAVVAIPVARGASDAPVHHEFGGIFGDLRVQIVHQHAQRRFGHPGTRAQGVAAGRADDSRFHGGEHGHILRGGNAPTVHIGNRGEKDAPPRRLSLRSTCV